ncbi:uncharacterized protein METZ01_LOCUS457308, partial [marine metagenome]
EMVISMDYEINLNQGANLISFHGLPDNVTTSSVFDDLIPTVYSVLGEGSSAWYMSDEGYWIGSLVNLELTSAYWVFTNDECTLSGAGHPYNLNRVYDLHVGANLVSFPSRGSDYVSDALPDEIEGHILAILGQGVSAIQVDGNWYGALIDFHENQGYWFITDADFSFSYELSTENMLSRSAEFSYMTKRPETLKFIQSSEQAFYFIDEESFENVNINNGDWLVSICGSTWSGSRQYLGETIDIPVMGSDGQTV